MGLENLKKELLNEAKKKAEQIAREADDEAKSIMSNARQKLKEMNEKSEQDVKRVLAEMEKKSMASISIERRKSLLELKKDIIEEVFEVAKKELSWLSDDRRREHIQKLLEKAARNIDVSYVYANPKDRKFVKQNFAEKNIIGGVVVEDGEQTMSIDLSYENMLEEIKGEYIGEIGKIIFA